MNAITRQFLANFSTQKVNFGISGAFGHSMQQFIPVYWIVNDFKKNKALNNYGITDDSAAARTLANFFLLGVTTTGDRFQDLCKLITNQVVTQKGYQANDYSRVYKLVKDAIYSGKDKTGILEGVQIEVQPGTGKTPEYGTEILPDKAGIREITRARRKGEDVRV